MSDEEELVRVGPQPYPPRIVKGVRSRRIRPGESITLSVEVDGRPNPKFQWFFNEEPLEAGPEIFFTSDDRRSKITIRKPKEGNYTVRAINEAGMASSSGYVLIRGKTWQIFKFRTFFNNFRERFSNS